MMRYGGESISDCVCGDPACVRVHGGRYWVSCSRRSRRHGPGDVPEVGSHDGFDTLHGAVEAWNALMTRGGAL